MTFINSVRYGNFKKLTLFFFILIFAAMPLLAQDLSLGPENIRIEEKSDGGFHLYIQKKPDIASVLLTESTRDPSMNSDNYALRASGWNPTNGNEIRLLDGVPIPRESKIYSLVSSTVETHPELGEAFHIFIPWIVYYGYESGRHGEIYMADGTYLNIRAFSLPYADYRGYFADNPFVLHVVQKIPERPEGKYVEEAVHAFGEIADQGKGDFIYVTDPSDLIDKIENALRQEAGSSVDIVLCIDTTGSMKPYIDEVRKKLIPMMKGIVAEFTKFRIGMVLYKDYFDEYLNKVIPFTGDFNLFQRNLNAIVVRGGGDLPEAVYEALYEAADKFPWASESKLILLVGDAPPHPRPRGKITKEMVYKLAADKGLKLSAMLLPE